MGHRQFTDETGAEWTVYDIVPGADDRRTKDRRASDGTDQPADAERRQEDRRVVFRSSRPVRLTRGWLCFEKAGERRRLQPIPENWNHLPEDALVALLKEARIARRKQIVDPDGAGTGRR